MHRLTPDRRPRIALAQFGVDRSEPGVQLGVDHRIEAGHRLGRSFGSGSSLGMSAASVRESPCAVDPARRMDPACTVAAPAATVSSQDHHVGRSVDVRSGARPGVIFRFRAGQQRQIRDHRREMGNDSGMSNEEGGAYVNPGGEFTRDQRYIATRITADGRDGYPVEPGRYRLVVSRACPWANRAIIVRRLLGLEDVAVDGRRRADPRRAELDLRPRSRRPRPGARHRTAAGGVLRPVPRLRAGHHRAGDRRRPDRRRWSPTTTPRSPSTCPPSGRAYHRPGAPDLYPGGICGTRSTR